MEGAAPVLTTAAVLDVPRSKEQEELDSAAKDELFDQTNLLPPSRIILVFFALGTGVLLSILEASIMATSLSTISAALGAGTKGSWIVTSYLLAQCALCPCWGRLSDILGELHSRTTVSLRTLTLDDRSQAPPSLVPRRVSFGISRLFTGKLCYPISSRTR